MLRSGIRWSDVADDDSLDASYLAPVQAEAVASPTAPLPESQTVSALPSKKSSFAELFSASAPPPASKASVPSQKLKIQAGMPNQNQAKTAPIDFKQNIASWADLTAKLTGKPASAAAPAPVPESAPVSDAEVAKRLNFDEAEEESMQDAKTEEKKAERFDPELDCSRDGLPLLFKQMSAPTNLASMSERDEPEETARHGQKRKVETPKINTSAQQLNAWTNAQSLVQMMKGDEKSAAAAQPQTPKPVSKKQKMSSPESAPQQPKLVVNPSLSFASVLCPTTPQSSKNSSMAPPPLRSQVSAPAGLESQTPPRAKIPPPQPNSEAERQVQRKKQIDLGKRTVGYSCYLASVPKGQRTASHLSTPDIKKKCSKRSWDGLVRQWRRFLHSFDPKVEGESDEQRALREAEQEKAEEAEEQALEAAQQIAQQAAEEDL